MTHKKYREAPSIKPRNKWFYRIGSSFNVVFSRVTLYKLDHPYTFQAINDFYNSLIKGLNGQSRIVLIMKHNQFFIEDEPFDSKLNTSRILSHFKQSATESISFENGIKDGEITNFFKVFCDLKKYPCADDMQAKIQKSGISHIKLKAVIHLSQVTKKNERL